MTKLSQAGFVVVELNEWDSTNIRVWIFDNDLDAYKFLGEMRNKYPANYYTLKRANQIKINE